jgi:hypothetical protein
MKKIIAVFGILAASVAFAGDEKAQAAKTTEVVVVAKPSRYRIVTSPVEVLKTEVVTKTSTSPATLVVEEKRGLFGKWKPRNTSVVVIQEKK